MSLLRYREPLRIPIYLGRLAKSQFPIATKNPSLLGYTAQIPVPV